ncbi:hypothetical protein BUALT_Bualt17G0101600 [Buddleja alternifolia]|uniref:SWIM-type domain-containing protein n=1 Tax=Buddleja alternifolia TaxID=168488 RepID=A0AAV6WFW5_9LAMI|nr:hypothetical protein BUALT_Bualt17G0101600 [Buddleja alternifolia]
MRDEALSVDNEFCVLNLLVLYYLVSPEDNEFTIKINHGGEFIGPKKIYSGGEIDYIDHCSVHTMSLKVIEEDIYKKMLGYEGLVGFYYLIPRLSLEEGLIFILGEEDINRMVQLAVPNREISVYVTQTSDIEFLEDWIRNVDGPVDETQRPEELSDLDASLYDSDYGLSEEDCEKDDCDFDANTHPEGSEQETEDKSTWKWFLELLQQDLSIYEQEKWSFISDRQKGLLPALYDIFPEVEHRYCVRHMYTNFKKSHPGLALKDRLWNLAKASTEAQFTLQMQSLKDLDEAAHQWIGEVHPKHWSRSYFRTYPKCDILLNNICESFNSTLLEARNKPLLNMLERIRIYIQKRLQVRRELTDKWNDAICPKIQTTLEKLKNDTRSCMARYVGGTKFEVKDMYQGQYAVDIGLRTCSCRRWDLCGIPCIHGVSAIVASDREPEEYVHRCYNKETFLKAYGFIINPVRGQVEWPKTGRGPVSPNFEFRLPGRPKKYRKKDDGEQPRAASKKKKLRKVGQKSVKCGICGTRGHNRVKCTTLKPIYEEENIVTEPEDPENRVSSPHILGNVHIPEIAQGPGPMPKKKRKCSVCLREGHNRAKCPTAAGRMWQNIDFYGYNGQKDLNLSNTGGSKKSKDKSKASSSSHAVTEPVNVPQKSKSKEVSSNLMIAHINAKEIGTSIFTIQNVSPPQPPIRDDASLSQIVCIGGIPVHTKFMKSGKSCVTLSSLQAAASQRVTKQTSSL